MRFGEEVVEAFVAMRRFLSANEQVFQRLETIEYKLLESDQKFEDIYSKLEEKSLKPRQGIPKRSLVLEKQMVDVLTEQSYAI